MGQHDAVSRTGYRKSVKTLIVIWERQMTSLRVRTRKSRKANKRWMKDLGVVFDSELFCFSLRREDKQSKLHAGFD